MEKTTLIDLPQLRRRIDKLENETKIIERVFACFLDALLGDGQGLDTFEDFLIAMTTILVLGIIYLAVYYSLHKYAKWNGKHSNTAGILAIIGAIFIFVTVCLVIDPPK